MPALARSPRYAATRRRRQQVCSAARRRVRQSRLREGGMKFGKRFANARRHDWTYLDYKGLKKLIKQLFEGLQDAANGPGLCGGPV